MQTYKKKAGKVTSSLFHKFVLGITSFHVTPLPELLHSEKTAVKSDFFMLLL